jgi:hypothetical protein
MRQWHPKLRYLACNFLWGPIKAAFSVRACPKEGWPDGGSHYKVGNIMRIGLRNKIMLIAAPCAGVLGLALMSPVSANVITGNPSTDGGWTSEGMSATASNYIDGAGNYNATVYSTEFQLDATSPLLSTLGGFDWNVGDTVVGVGGVFSGANSDLTYSGGADENNVTHTGSTSTRIVVKYGTSSATWAVDTPSPTTAPGYGSLAHGGVGSVLLGNYPYDFYPADAGTLIVPADSPEEQTSVSGTTTISGDVARTITAWSSGALVGFESFLDLTLLDSEYPSNGVALGDDFDLDLQRGSGNFQDSLGTLPAVPEPASLGLACLAGVGILSRRKRRA